MRTPPRRLGPRPASRLLTACLLAGTIVAAGAGAQASPSVQEPQSASPQDPQQPEPIPVDVEASRLGDPVRELRLDEALRIGRSFNVGLRAAELLPEQTRLDVLFAEAGFQPELYGNVGYTEAQSPQRNTFQPSIASTTADATLGWRQRVVTGGLFDLAFNPARFDSDGGGGFFPNRQFTSEFALSFRQPLLRGAWTEVNLAQINAARYRASQADHTYQRVVQDTLLQIVQAYWELVFARENWRVVHSARAVAEEQLRITLERIRVEELAARDRVADEAEVARRTEEQIVAENAIRTREDELRRLMFDGSDPGVWRINLRPSSPIAVEPGDAVLSFETLVEVAVKNRPDLQSLRSAVAAAEVSLVEAERQTLPNLDLISSYSTDGVRNGFGSAFVDSIDQQYPDWSVRLEFAIPIGNQAARSRAQRARLEVERQRRLLHAATLDVTRDVREAVRALTTLAQSIRASAESVRLAETNLETEQVKLRVGASTAFEVQRRNQELREARSRHLRNQLDYRTAESRLLYVQGLLRADGE